MDCGTNGGLLYYVHGSKKQHSQPFISQTNKKFKDIFRKLIWDGKFIILPNKGIL